MKRSEINRSIDRALDFFSSANFPLPPWAYWSPRDWADAGSDCAEIRAVRLGWDVTDFGSGDLARTGRTIFTLRNGRHNDADYSKTYAEKVMCLFPQQKSSIHCHRHKREDIICRGGGVVAIELWQATPDEQLADVPLTVSLDGRAATVPAGRALHLEPGCSICVPPMVYHRFWGEGDGPVLSVEVSSVCDDLTDNLFLHAGERFPSIDEDEPRRWVLCSEYDQLTASIE
jgi:hypothetical protein